jgi:flagellar assembly protein FliH
VSSFRRIIKAEQVQLMAAGQLAPLRPAAPLTPPMAPLAVAAVIEAPAGPDPAIAAAEAQQIVQAAYAQATDIESAAQTHAAETTRQARAEGLQAAETETGQLLLAAHGVLDEVETWRQRLLAQSEPLVIQLVSAVGRKLFGAGLTLPPELLQTAFNQALTEARPLGNLRIRLNPADAEVLGPHWPPPSSASQSLELVPDSAVRRGGCLIDGDNGTVDARVETQLDLTLASLTQTAADAAESREHQP